MPSVKIEPSWAQVLQPEFDKPYFTELTAFVKQEYASQTVCPPAGLIFNAFNLTPYDQVRVVILGQDPYHNQGQAHGLAFSVPTGVRLPPSLINIFQEAKDDVGTRPPSGDLTPWAQQGVLLLNTCLTVRAHTPLSHQGKGWETFTDAVISLLASQREGLVFILWGSPAQKKAKLIPADKHLVLKAVHPSPLSAHRGFFGSKPFSQTNAYLIRMGQAPINW